MNIQDMRRAAKTASRTNGTSHQTELNNIAVRHGHSHWGAMLVACKKQNDAATARIASTAATISGFGADWTNIDRTNAHQLQDARNRRSHIVFTFADRRMSLAHVMAMSGTLDKLPHDSVDRLPRRIEAAPEVVVLEGLRGAKNEWLGTRTVTETELLELDAGTIVIVQHLLRRHIDTANKLGLMIIGMATPRTVKSWSAGVRDRLITYFDPDPVMVQVDTCITDKGEEPVYRIQPIRRAVLREVDQAAAAA